MNIKNGLLLLGSANMLLFCACQNSTKEQTSDQTEPEKKQKPNILFIGVDDLRPELGCYGEKEIISPHIDAFAAQGVLFTNAYCNAPVSGASRTSLLTGVRPKHDTIFQWDARADEDIPDFPTLPEYLKSNDYYTISNGKVFHHLDDSPESWSEPAWVPPGSFPRYILEESKKMEGRGPATEKVAGHDTIYPDGKIAYKTIEDLKRVKQMDKPFFIAAGFRRPHLPFIAPEKYWDMYNPDSISLAPNPFKPENAPDQAIHNSGELRNYSDVPDEKPFTDEQKRLYKHGYYACVTYVDAMIGEVLNALDSLGLAENTIVVLWGDHGWLLGEHTMWCKQCNFNDALHSPLIIKKPGNKPAKTNAPVEFVDLYPTITELCNLASPPHVDGESLAPLLTNPAMKWENEIFARFYHQISVKSGNYLYTEWYVPGYIPKYAHMKDSVYAYMLYNHESDPQENTDISKLPENKKLVEEMSAKLNKYFK